MFEKNQDILLHPKGATTMPTGIKVLVCDDDAAFCKKMADLVRKSQPVDGCSAAVTTCCDPVALTDKALGQFDIAFLDIDMGAYSGLELAHHIRSMNLDTILIFVTNYVQYSLEGYEVQAFRYLLKSELEEKLPGYTKRHWKNYSIPPMKLHSAQTVSNSTLNIRIFCTWKAGSA